MNPVRALLLPRFSHWADRYWPGIALPLLALPPAGGVICGGTSGRRQHQNGALAPNGS
jgi:hypothetical protein